MTISGPCVVLGISVLIAKYYSLNPIHPIVISFSIIQCLLFFVNLKDEIGDYFNEERYGLTCQVRKLEDERKKQNDDYATRLAKLKEQEAKLKEQEKLLHTLIYSKTPFKDSANLSADLESLIFADSSNYLKHKHRPARTAAKEIDNMRKIYHQTLRLSKEIQYKYDYILSAFPEIAEYAENDGELIAVGEYYSYSEIDDIRDKRKDYISDEEYRSLSEDQRSQLALDRYIASRNKSKWQIGRDYEMCCAFYLQQQGYYVDMHGIKYKKEDLGRDLIAIKQRGGLFDNEILIVQCKNWSAEHKIHENVIMQLFGTTIEYLISNNKLDKAVIPVLMIPTYTEVTLKAMSFAKKLNVRIWRVPFTEYPRIKCNINNGCKIYHLPFDQQYDRTEVKLNGEFFAKTVAEAVAHGFRRAKRHFLTNQS